MTDLLRPPIRWVKTNQPDVETVTIYTIRREAIPLSPQGKRKPIPRLMIGRGRVFVEKTRRTTD